MSYAAFGSYIGTDGSVCTSSTYTIPCGCPGIFVLVSKGVKQYCTTECPEHYDVRLDPVDGSALCVEPAAEPSAPKPSGADSTSDPPSSASVGRGPLMLLVALGVVGAALWYRSI